ncbi:HWE histidine kinase domain-containing protein [Fulvimarina sp. 2208YS6-2-32]|uniref:histidine kinase n=1 Tax=Fulvimarina uroteuthidis TaxID=3098149 RepID=A0ABU5HZ71_9HYPH|nr:HWE histidine kinase domain-containing protein [Fulvimarina sp. 2208YS6-2-32]MDY8108382.1 HWE histidine kinase domain-containing protein [Fulvimarina sp. 2208YS6-2-32]
MSLGNNAGPSKRFLQWSRLSFPWARLRPGRFTHAMLRPSLLVHLTTLTLIVLAPALLFSAFLIFRFSEQQEELARSQVYDMAEIVSNAFDREVVALLATARVLATSGAIEEENFPSFRNRSVRALKDSGIVADLVDDEGMVVISTAPTQTDEPAIQQHERDVVSAARESGNAGVSGVAYDPRIKRAVFLVAVPTSDAPGSRFVVVLTKPLESLERVIEKGSLPGAWSVVVEDRAGKKIFSAGAADGQMFGPRVFAAESLDAPPHAGGGAEEQIVAANTSYLTGWRSTVSVSTEIIERPIMRSWYALIAVGLILTGFSIVLGILTGRRVARPILELSRQARAIGRGEPAVTVTTNIAEIGDVSKVLNRASRERIEAEEQTRLLMREMTHRAKNQYALVAAIARRAARESADTGQFLDTLSDALASLARSADLLSSQNWESVELSALIDNQLSAFGVQTRRIRYSGPKLRVNASVAQTIGLALHELATNAAKYGALSVDDGVVTIDWSYDDVFRMEWRETGGPPVKPPTRSGFGTLVTQKMTSRGLGGKVSMSFAETGVVWSLEAPTESAEPVTGKHGD